MAYDAPTVSDLQTRFPTFSAVADATIQGALDEAAGRVDESWTEADYAPAILLFAAHVLTMDGQGTASEAQLAGFKRIKVSSLELERDTGGASTSSSMLLSTSYGRRFADMQKRNVGGPVLLS